MGRGLSLLQRYIEVLISLLVVMYGVSVWAADAQVDVLPAVNGEDSRENIPGV